MGYETIIADTGTSLGFLLPYREVKKLEITYRALRIVQVL